VWNRPPKQGGDRGLSSPRRHSWSWQSANSFDLQPPPWSQCWMEPL